MKCFIIFLTIFTFYNNNYLTNTKTEQHVLTKPEAAQYSTHINLNKNIG